MSVSIMERADYVKPDWPPRMKKGIMTLLNQPSMARIDSRRIVFILLFRKPRLETSASRG